MNKPLNGKVAIVTGGSKGIGQAISEALAADGACVVVNYSSDAGSANDTVDAITKNGGQALAVKGSVASPEDVETLFAATLNHFGAPDILVCNAGVSALHPITEVSEEEFDRIYGINVKGLMFLLRTAAKQLKDNGRVITISSTTAVSPAPNSFLYASSKAAASMMTQIAATELGPRGITVNAILPGLTETPMIANMPPAYKEAAASSSPFGRIGKPEDISCIAAFLAREEAQWVTGQTIIANGGAKR